jgi:ribose-phosphate pyrophosphokinase
LWSAAFDFAKMLKVMGVDCVVSVDLQRPGQGHEACFFDNTIPVESVYSGNVMAKYFIDNVKLQNYKDTGSPRLAVVSANTKCVKKTRRFQKYFSEELKTPVGFAVFLQTSKQDSEEGIDMVKSDVTTEILGDVLDADVVIVDEQVDTGATLAALCHKLKKEGARRIFICASHGLFSGNSMEMIDLSPVEQVIVTDSVPLPAKASDKIVQIPLAPMLAKIVEANVIHMDTAKQDRREEVFGSLLDESEDFTLE